MDSEHQSRYRGSTGTISTTREPNSSSHVTNGSGSVYDGKHQPSTGAAPVLPGMTPEEIVNYLRSGRLLMVNSRRRNGLIVFKPFHAEFAGPGAAIGTYLDEDCQRVVPVGNLSLLSPDSHEERQKAYLIRRQWIRLTYEFTEKESPLQRAQLILNQFGTYFDQTTISKIPDEAFALLVGVFPHTIRMARRIGF